MGNNKLKIIKDYEKLSDELLELLKLEYPNGFTDYIIQYINPKDGKLIRAIELETEEKLYMIRLPNNVINDILEEEEDIEADDILDEDLIDDKIEVANTTAYSDIEKEIIVEDEDESNDEDNDNLTDDDEEEVEEDEFSDLNFDEGEEDFDENEEYYEEDDIF